jgi:hypothetical protein
MLALGAKYDPSLAFVDMERFLRDPAAFSDLFPKANKPAQINGAALEVENVGQAGDAAVCDEPAADAMETT